MKEYKYIINGTEYNVQIGDIVENIANVTVNGEDFKVEMEKEPEPEKKKVVVKTGAAKVEAAPTEKAAAGPVNTNNALKAPLPGVITDIKVAVGDEVKAGDTVVVLEAMKMANNLDATKGGKVTAVLVNVGDSVMEDTPLVVIE
ncbi:MAG: biotin/lipoyl-binding protein [Prevotella sp.]|nr:biotin/lipoyl-binding protein [Prevotella sp.]